MKVINKKTESTASAVVITGDLPNGDEFYAFSKEGLFFVEIEGGRILEEKIPILTEEEMIEIIHEKTDYEL